MIQFVNPDLFDAMRCEIKPDLEFADRVLESWLSDVEFDESLKTSKLIANR